MIHLHPQIRGRLSVVAEGKVGSPDLSGDGRSVVFNEYVNGNEDVRLSRDGQVSELSSDPRAEIHPAVSRDGSTVVWNRFSSTDFTDPDASWDVVGLRDGQPIVVSERNSNEMSPDLSADGRLAVWDENIGGGRYDRNIQRWNGTGCSPITEGEGTNMYPKLSPDGSRVVWRRFEDGKASLWLQDQAGVVKPFLENEHGLFGVALDEHGQNVALCAGGEDDKDLFLYHEPSGTMTLVAGERGVDEEAPALSGDAQTLAFEHWDWRGGTPARVNIYLKQGEGEPKQVTLADEGLNMGPVLSADGKTLVWTWVDAKDVDHRKILKLELE